jgi:acyl carrier protein
MEYYGNLKTFIAKEFLYNNNQSSLHSDTPLIEDGIIDSMGLVKLIEHIERTYLIKINVEEIDIENFRDIDSIEKFLSAKINK